MSYRMALLFFFAGRMVCIFRTQTIIMPQVIVIVGSLRKAAFSRKLANNLISLAPPSLSLRIAEIIQLPLYNPDLEGAGAPEAWLAFRALVKATDAVLFVTPEHNRSVPAALKNAIDIASRPRGQNMWDGKPAAVASISPGAIGAFGSNNHLRQSLMAVNMPLCRNRKSISAALKPFSMPPGPLQTRIPARFWRAS